MKFGGVVPTSPPGGGVVAPPSSPRKRFPTYQLVLVVTVLNALCIVPVLNKSRHTMLLIFLQEQQQQLGEVPTAKISATHHNHVNVSSVQRHDGHRHEKDYDDHNHDHDKVEAGGAIGVEMPPPPPPPPQQQQQYKSASTTYNSQHLSPPPPPPQSERLWKGGSEMPDLPQYIHEYVEFHRSKIYIDPTDGVPYLKDPNATKYILYKCGYDDDSGQGRYCGGAVDRLNAMLTLLHVAICTKRVLILNVTHPFPLQQFLLPNKVRWDVENYVPVGRLLKSNNRPPKPFLLNPRNGNLFPHDVVGIQVSTNLWLGNPKHNYSDYDACMTHPTVAAAVRRKSGIEEEEDGNANGNGNTTHTTKNSNNVVVAFDKNNTHAQNMYRWAFWTLFKFHDSVLDRVRTLKYHAGLLDLVPPAVATPSSSSSPHSSAAQPQPQQQRNEQQQVVQYQYKPYVAVHVRTGRGFRNGGDQARHVGEDVFKEFFHCVQRFRETIDTMKQPQQQQLQREPSGSSSGPSAMKNVTTASQQRRWSRSVYLATDNPKVKSFMKKWDTSIESGHDVVSFHIDKSDPNKSPNATNDIINMWAEFVMLIDSECLVRSRSGFSEAPQYLSFSNTRTYETCSVYFESCLPENVNYAVSQLGAL